VLPESYVTFSVKNDRGIIISREDLHWNYFRERNFIFLFLFLC